jgi:hypothetical protein
MKQLEKGLGVFVAVSLILLFTHVEGGAFLSMVSLLLLTCFYYIFSFALLHDLTLREIFNKQSYNGLSVLRVIGAIAAGISLATLCIAISYKVLSLEGADDMMLAGFLSCMIVAVFALYKFYQGRNEFYLKILKRIAIMG